jgi:hypothetical protein
MVDPFLFDSERDLCDCPLHVLLAQFSDIAFHNFCAFRVALAVTTKMLANGVELENPEQSWFKKSGVR